MPSRFLSNIGITSFKKACCFRQEEQNADLWCRYWRVKNLLGHSTPWRGHAKDYLPEHFLGDPDAMVEAIARLLPRLCEGTLPHSIGFGCLGWVVDGVVYEAINLGISTYPLQKALQAAGIMSVYVENDARCTLLAELNFGALRDCTNAAMVTD